MAFIYDLTDTWNAGGTTFNAIKMNVTDTASAAASKLITVQVGGSERFGVRKDGQGYFAGNVGIGTTSPDARLDVLGASGDQLRLRTAETEEYRIGRNASTGLLDFYGSQTGFTGYTFGGINGERMRIDSAGNVGIGTTSPDARLTVSGAISASLGAVGTPAYTFAGDLNTGMWSPAADTIAFSEGGVEVMRLDSAGNVGIGTTAPERRLHVVSNQPLRMGTATDWFQFTQTNTNVYGWLSSSSQYALTMNGATGAVAVNTVTLDAAAQLQVDSITRGFLPPRMTTTQRDAIASPPNGLMLYNTTTNKLQVRAAGAWVDLH
ncbi:hypothetical protein UFOVP317_17 [uncultured Caudovirales phage]|uniref:Uncharacterized protein n=1 Tax=uncultured Caudovirales phage TaxID=2100421 RepID=A0A6J5LZJ9_9CAUD|nr:hypothetical protein UFOVP317_17 [uncultured Caudovirales phage]